MTPSDTLHTLTTAESVLADSIITDSTAADSIATENPGAIVVTPTHTPLPITARNDNSIAASWIIMGLLMVLCVICARYKSNTKYLKRLFSDLTDTRERGNVFDDTSSETTFIITLNVLCAFSMGLMLYIGMCTLGPLQMKADGFTNQAWTCIAATGLYCLAMPIIYTIAGNIFSTAGHTRLWTRGFMASQALTGLLLLLPALMAFFYPDAAKALTYTAITIYITLKIIFISKTFRIFFKHFAAWLLFLYYLCIVEIIPLFLTYSIALILAS